MFHRYQTYTSKFHQTRVSEQRLGQSDSSSIYAEVCSSVYKLEHSSTVTTDLSSNQTSAPPRSNKSTVAASKRVYGENVCSVKLLIKRLQKILANAAR